MLNDWNDFRKSFSFSKDSNIQVSQDHTTNLEPVQRLRTPPKPAHSGPYSPNPF